MKERKLTLKNNKKIAIVYRLHSPEAVRMASCNPAEFLKSGHDVGRIAPGQRANLVLVDDELNVKGVWIDGREN